MDARGLGAARWERPTGGRGEGGFGRGRRPLDGHGVAEDLREHVGGGRRRRLTGRCSGLGELLREAADGGLRLMEEERAFLGGGDAAGEEAHGRWRN